MFKYCPYCGEQIDFKAVACRFCKRVLDNDEYNTLNKGANQPVTLGSPEKESNFPVTITNNKTEVVIKYQKSPMLPALLSVIPGMGQIYNREGGKGLAMLGGFLLASFISFSLLSSTFCLGIFSMPIPAAIWIWNILDAYQTAERNNRKQLLGID